MYDSATARAAVLDRIRTSLGEPTAPAQIAAEYKSLPRDYRRSSSLSLEDLLAMFQERLEEYGAGVRRTTAERISESILETLQLRGKHTMVVPAGVPGAWLPEGIRFEDATVFDADRLNASEGMLSGCTVAIALSGSIVLQNAPAQGPRILSLVPDYHLCVVFANQVVETVPESFDRLRATESLPTTFISGPSATADIEMTRIKGVHGPRFLDVILVV